MTRRWSWRRIKRDERGIFLVWFALVLTLLMAMAGFAVDFWRWNDEGAKEQKAVDAAALAGAVYIETEPTTAYSVVTDLLKKNGYENGKNSTTVTMEPGTRSNQIKVKLSRTVKNYFGGFVGVSNTTITKHAVAEYLRKVNMGSPANQFGNDPQLCTPPGQTPTTHGTPRCPDFWANVFGPDSPKGNGDAIASENCGTNVDNCSGGTNSDNDPDGYIYGVNVGSITASPLTIQAFDPAFAHVGDNCGNSNDGSNLIGASQLNGSTFTFDGIPPNVRYSPVSNSPYCTGDQYYSNTGNELPWTTYTVRGPDDTPNDAKDNPVICQLDFPGFKGDLRAALLSSSAQSGAPGLFREYFRRWYTLCTIPSPQTDSTYYVQVETKTKANGSAAPDGGGANRFALRGGLAGSYNSLNTGKVQIYGEGVMGIYANAPAAQTTIYLARVLPGAAGQSLVLNFFDVGDAPNGSTGTLQILPSVDMRNNNQPMNWFSGCTYTPVPGNSTGPPWGTFTNTGSNCTISNVSSANGYNGQWLTLRIPIPAQYSCSVSNPNGCWARIKFAFSANVNDTTTWKASLSGSPVRIIE